MVPSNNSRTLQLLLTGAYLCLSLRVGDVQFADIRQFVAFQSLAAAGFSAGGGLGMGVSPLKDCLAKVGALSVPPSRPRACAARAAYAACTPARYPRPRPDAPIAAATVQANRWQQGGLRRRQRHRQLGSPPRGRLGLLQQRYRAACSCLLLTFSVISASAHAMLSLTLCCAAEQLLSS